jgi:hypothetical protein
MTRRKQQTAVQSAEESTEEVGVAMTDTTEQPQEPVPEPAQEQPAPKAKPKKQPAPNVKGPRIYIGPTLPGTQLVQHTVYKDELPAHLRPLLEACKALKFLFVPASQLAVKRQRLTDKTSPEAVRYAEVRKHFMTKGA